MIPVVGYSDDLGVLIAAMGSVAMHVKKDHRRKAKKIIKRWFGSDEDSFGALVPSG
jgi:uncharacterized membrane protein YkvA (DUF1232 family)